MLKEAMNEVEKIARDGDGALDAAGTKVCCTVH